MRPSDCSTTQSVAPRGLSTRPMPVAPPGCAASVAPVADRLGEQPVEEVERLPQLERALLEAGSGIAGTGPPGRPLRSRRTRAGRWFAARHPASPAAARGGADGAQRQRGLLRDDADARQPVLERGVEDQLAPAVPGLLGERSELVPRGARPVGVEGEPALPDRDGAEQEPVARQRLVESPRALGERGEERVPRGETHAGADGGDVVEVVPDALELEQDRACASEVGRRPDAERLLARVRVRDAVRDRARRARALAYARPSSSVCPSAARSSPRCL